MSTFLDFNHERGTWYEYKEEDGRGHVSIMQDVQPVLDLARDQRNSGINDKVGDFGHYAIIPAHIEVALRQRGINIYDQNQTKELLKVINQEYPHLKTTNLHHELK